MTTKKPELPGGFKDYLPEEEKQRLKLIKKASRTFERFGFLPMSTPSIEKLKTLTRKDEELNKQIFEIKRKEEKQGLGLRFDLTVPLARAIASYPKEIQNPAKLYRIGNAWRGEKPQAGRFREFLQCDFDIVGAPGSMADAEIVAVAYEVLSEIGVSSFLIKINNRKILDGLADFVGFNKKLAPEIFKILDKKDKQSWKETESQLKKVGLNKKQTELIKEFLEIEGGYDDVLREVDSRLKSKRAKEGVEELREMVGFLSAMGVPEENWAIDLSIVRGLDYYTGFIFETVLTNLTKIGSVLSGGRYDELIEEFSGSPVPVIGASLGFDRLFDGLKELELLKRLDPEPKVLVLNFDESTKLECLSLVSELRRNDISSSIYLGQEDNLKGQLAYAVKTQVPIVIIMGEREKERGVVQIKDMMDRNQKEVPYETVVSEVKNILK